MTEPNTNDELDEILIDFASFFNFDPMLVKPEPFDSELAEAKAKIEALITRKQTEALEKFGLEKGVKYDVKKSDTVIVITKAEGELKGKEKNG